MWSTSSAASLGKSTRPRHVPESLPFGPAATCGSRQGVFPLSGASGPGKKGEREIGEIEISFWSFPFGQLLPPQCYGVHLRTTEDKQFIRARIEMYFILF